MKTIKAVVKWFQKYPLTPREQSRVENLFDNIKIGAIMLVILVATLWLANLAGCYEGRVTQSDIEEMNIN